MKLSMAPLVTAVLFVVALAVAVMSMFGSEAIMLSFITMGTFCLGLLVLGIPFLARFALASPDVDKTKLPKYRLAPAMAILMAAIVIGSITIAVNYVGTNPFSREIVRHADNEAEAALLAKAEGLDYGSFISTERYNNTRGEPLCRFIDKDIIDYFYGRVGEYQSRGPPNRATMKYEAWVYTAGSLRFRVDSGFDPRFNFTIGPENLSFWGFMEQGDDSRIASWNGTTYKIMTAKSAITIDNVSAGGHLVVMRLKFTCEPSGGDLLITQARQYVHFDSDGNPVRIAFERHEGDIIYG